MQDLESIAKISIDCGFHLHKDIGPGLLESVYEILLLNEAFRADLIVEKRLLLELKSTERHSPVHAKQLLTYLRLMNLPLGFLMNFGAATFKEGVKRLANNYFRG